LIVFWEVSWEVAAVVLGLLAAAEAKEKSRLTPFGVNFMRSPVLLYQAAEAKHMWRIATSPFLPRYAQIKLLSPENVF